ncbi:MAG: hypothetical protein BWY69_00205 [Planctomycetes bacterium ADurb.Bin401]|nr:MAG: hypothetical protein BWY69_00205 [Planctomycetes bacterium ADurb.Bin401]
MKYQSFCPRPPRFKRLSIWQKNKFLQKQLSKFPLPLSSLEIVDFFHKINALPCADNLWIVNERIIHLVNNSAPLIYCAGFGNIIFLNIRLIQRFNCRSKRNQKFRCLLMSVSRRQIKRRSSFKIFCIYLSASFNQHFAHIRTAPCRRQMQRRIAVRIFRVYVRAFGNQHFRHFLMTVLYSKVQRCFSIGMHAIFICFRLSFIRIYPSLSFLISPANTVSFTIKYSFFIFCFNT